MKDANLRPLKNGSVQPGRDTLKFAFLKNLLVLSMIGLSWCNQYTSTRAPSDANFATKNLSLSH